MALVGRVAAIIGICVALIACTIWVAVGAFSVAAGPLCAECMQAWLPPVALGVLGPLLPIAIWTVALIAQWRRPLLLVWGLVGWPILGTVNVWAIEWFAKLFQT